jgi:hypothetical protein
VIERRVLIGHQRGAADPAEMEGGQIDREHAEVDQARRDQRALGVVDAVVRARRDAADLGDAVAQHADAARDRLGLSRQDQAAVDDAQRSQRGLAHAQPSTPRRLRVSTSRHAMRIATPIST